MNDNSAFPKTRTGHTDAPHDTTQGTQDGTTPHAGGGRADSDPVTVAAPIAICGQACRLPGAASPTAYWSLLREGRHAIGKIPEDRWGSDKFDGPMLYSELQRPMPGRSYTRAAGILDNLWDFDPAFFGISPREAEQMDPQ